MDENITETLNISAGHIYESIMQNSCDAITVSDLDGQIKIANQAFINLIGANEENIIGSALNKFIKMDSGDLTADTTCSAGSSYVSNNGQQGAGENPSISFTEQITKTAKILNSAGLELLMPATQCQIVDNHKQPIAYLTIVYVVESSCVQQAQTDFVSTVSHELRTPLTSIKGFADTILRSGNKLDLTQQRRYVGIIKDQADRLTRLVEDLLAVSRLESKKLQLTIRAIDLADAVERVVRNMADRTGSHRIVIDIPAGLPAVWADADRLEQILTNLIDNAIKYSPSDTTVTIEAHELGKNSETVEFSVTDQGEGIPEEHLKKIFTKFGRLDNPLVRQTEGTGLGLYITRSLVLALAGKISVHSKPGQTTFNVQLPVASLEEQAARGRG